MARTCKDWLKACRDHYLQSGGSAETWQGDYFKVLQHLPQDKPLTPRRLTQLLERWLPNTRSRHRAAHAAKYLARFAQVDWAPGTLKGRYKARPVDVTQIPSDDLIQTSFFTLRNPGWRWIYGVLAAYGLRPHEALRLDPDQFTRTTGKIAIPRDTKTGERLAYPLYPEWFNLFELGTPSQPQIKRDRSNALLGHAATEYFSVTAKLPFKLYSLRHAWARRAYLVDMDDVAASAMMGHSRAVHESIYRAWFSEIETDRAYNQVLSNPNRPAPPKLEAP